VRETRYGRFTLEKKLERRRKIMKRGIVGIIYILVSIGALLSVGIVSNGWAEEQEIRLGFSAPLTGPNAEMGVATRQGLELAAEEWNQKGGIYIKKWGKKVPIKMFIGDDQSKPEIAVSVGEKNITREKVHVHVISCASGPCMAAMELAPKYGLPVFGFQTISKDIADKVEKDPQRYWSFYKIGYNHDIYGAAVHGTYTYLMKKGLWKPKNKTIAYLVEETDWGRSNARTATELMVKEGFKQASMEAVPLGYTDWYPQLTKLKAMEPDILVSVMVAVSSGVALVKQFHEVGMKSSHFAIFYPNRPEYLPGAGNKADGVVWVPLLVDLSNPPQKAYAEKLKKRWNVSLNSDHIFADDGMQVTLEAIERAQSVEPKAIIEEMAKTDRKGLMGRYVFNQKTHTVQAGSGYLEMPVAQIVNGKSACIFPEDKASTTYKKPSWMN
jgi:branched-chain amino acid transport system substrate-binding protein